jgi:Protein of unknown function (DUF2793)
VSISNGPKIAVMDSAAIGDAYAVPMLQLFRMLQALLMSNVKGMLTTTPPSSPLNGDTYVVGSGATGLWTSKDLSIAYWTTDNSLYPLGNWEFWTPLAGWKVYNVPTSTSYTYNGATWVQSLQLQNSGSANSSQSILNLVGGTNISVTDTGNGTISISATGTVSAGFGSISAGTNTTSAMVVGTGASISFTGTGSINCNQICGVAVTTTTPSVNQALVYNGSAWAPTAIVNTFNSRSGAITPQFGDYSFPLLSGTASFTQVSSVLSSVQSLSTSATISITGIQDTLIKATGGSAGITLTLPTAVGVAGQILRFIKVDSAVGSITLTPDLSQTINSLTTYVLTNQWQTISMESDNANWIIVAAAG